MQNAFQRVQRLYSDAGARVEAFRLRGLPARRRAWVAWARLRDHKVDPRRIIEAWLTIELTIAADPQPVYKREFKQVQAAKLIHRMASGSHKRWEHTVRDPNNPFRDITRVQEMHVYPRSRGKVLRLLGADLENAAELVMDQHWSDLVATI